MANNDHEKPSIRRGKGIRLSTQATPHEGETAPPPAAPDPAAVTRGRGLALSTQTSTGDADAPSQPTSDTQAKEPTRADPAPPPGARSTPPPALTVLHDAFGPERLRTACGPLAYRQTGDGPPLLLIHGWGASARLWRSTAATLADRYTCYALDLPGAGGSPARDTSPTIPALAAEILAFADTLGLTHFDLFGHSLGAAAAAYLAGRHPRQVGRLVLANFGVRPFDFQLAALNAARGPLDLSVNLARPVFDLWQPLTRNLMQTPPVALLSAAVLLATLPADAQTWAEYLSDQASTDPRYSLTILTALGDSDLIKALSTISAPTLLLPGAADRFVPVLHAKAAQERIKESHLIALEACGHLPMVEQPATFHRLAGEFLKG